MYKVKYTKVALLPDGTRGNVSQGVDYAYIDCLTGYIEGKISHHLSEKAYPKKYYPIIESIERIPGHIVEGETICST